LASRRLVLVHISFLDGANELREFRLVLGSNFGECDNSGCLLVYHSTKSRLALDDSVRDAHLAAQGWNEDNQLNGIDIVGNKDEVGLLIFDETDYVVETVFDSIWLFGNVLTLLSFGDSSGFLL